MAASLLVRQLSEFRLFPRKLSVLRHGFARESTVSSNAPPNTDDIEEILQRRIQDLPVVNMANPYEKERQLCILCKYKVELNYKNTKLLSQFVSPFTGLVYSKNITGLCKKQYDRVCETVKVAQRAGLMPNVHKEIAFLKDPQLFVTTMTGRKKR